MPKKLFKKMAPDPAKIRNAKGFGWLAHWIANPALWHFHRHSVKKAFAIGLFWMSIPIPWQMIASALTAIPARANLPLSVALVWISNPLTMPPIFYFNYLVGTWLLHEKPQDIHWSFEPSALWHIIEQVGAPLYLGSVVVGLVLGGLSYIGLECFWRWHVGRAWARRRAKQQNAMH